MNQQQENLFNQYCEQRDIGVKTVDIRNAMLARNYPEWALCAIPAFEEAYQEMKK